MSLLFVAVPINAAYVHVHHTSLRFMSEYFTQHPDSGCGRVFH